MDERNGEVAEKAEEMILPGFRFHPTDEELVGFYLRRKIQQKPLSIELIRQLDIYKYDPWDLPKMATTGEKEWYFYCPRDRKYRNSARPNRVTGAGFWKATGTDRPIYAAEGAAKCIGLKKSLVFYRGRAAKGLKTDWMMHEFRLPSLPRSHADKSIHPNDSWAICRIFKKTSSMARRAPPNAWVSSSAAAPAGDFFAHARGAEPSAPAQHQLHSLLDFACPAGYRPAGPSFSGFFDAPPAGIDFGLQQRYQAAPPQLFALAPEVAAEMNGNPGGGQWGTLQTIAFPFSISSHIPELGKSSQAWDSAGCPGEMPAGYAAGKCYT